MNNPLRTVLGEMLSRYKSELAAEDAVLTLRKAVEKALADITGEAAKPAPRPARKAKPRKAAPKPAPKPAATKPLTAAAARRARRNKTGATRPLLTRARMVAGHAGVDWTALGKAEQNAYLQYVKDRDAGKDAKPPQVKGKARKTAAAKVAKAKAPKAPKAKPAKPAAVAPAPEAPKA